MSSLSRYGRRAYAQLRSAVYLRLWDYDRVDHVNCSRTTSAAGRTLDIVTIAYNNTRVIEHQIRLIAEYVLDPCCYIVADNSPDVVTRAEMRELCARRGVSYIGLPKNPYSGRSPSRSHGLALNWVYRHYVSHRQTQYFGFIDHDIFPIRRTSVIDLLDRQKVYGLIQERDDRWYLWPGFSFFRYDYVKDKHLDFGPSIGLDTGGGNWASLYMYLDRSQLVIPTHSYRQIRDGDSPQSDWIEYVGDWLHIFNASGWKSVAGKDILIEQLVLRH